MRERLLAAFVALTLLTVMLYGLPRALVRADVVEDDARTDLGRSAEAVAEVVSARRRAGLPAAGAPLAFVRSQDQVLYRVDGGTQLLAGRSQVAPEAVLATAPVDGGGSVEVRRSQAVVRQAVLKALQPIVLTGLAALAVAVVGAVLLATRLARPFQLLAERATALGRGQFDVELPPQPVREAEAIADALRTSSARVAVMLQREREFARNASHQLRTPLTGMRLRVEDVSTWPETPPSVRTELESVLQEVDRLSGTVTDLLAFAREERRGEWQQLAPADVLAAAAQRWQGLAAGLGRCVAVTDSSDGGLVLLPRLAVDQVLDVLVDNALGHGAGTVTLGVLTDRASRAVRLSVRDEGRVEVPEDRLFERRRGGDRRVGGEGIGLALSAELAQAAGGRLRLSRQDPTTFELVLPLPSS